MNVTSYDNIPKETLFNLFTFVSALNTLDARIRYKIKTAIRALLFGYKNIKCPLQDV
jgi:hypothetical protein